MGDYADMVLDGTLDEQTGEYVGDVNMSVYGEKAPGFPVSYANQVTVFCPCTWYHLVQHPCGNPDCKSNKS